MDDLIKYYDNYLENERLTRRNSYKIEYDTTIRILEKYLGSKNKITELGAATGKYSFHYAKVGHDVTAVEPVKSSLNQLETRARVKNQNITTILGESTNLQQIKNDSQDIVLILGPFYHLKNLKDRIKTLNEAYRILKKGGVVAVAYINKHFIMGLLAKHYPKLIGEKLITELMQNGTVSDAKAEQFLKIGYFSTPNEVEAAITGNGFRIEEHVATDGISKYFADNIDKFDEDKYELWLEFHINSCCEKSLLGYSNHGLLIARK